MSFLLVLLAFGREPGSFLLGDPGTKKKRKAWQASPLRGRRYQAPRNSRRRIPGLHPSVALDPASSVARRATQG